MWNPEIIEQGEIDAMRVAAERAKGNDTRQSASRDYCYNTARWLQTRLGGKVGMVDGHFVWLSSDEKYAIDIAGDRSAGYPIFQKTTNIFFEGVKPVNTDEFDDESTKRMIARADEEYDNLGNEVFKLALDYAGDSHPAQEPQAEADRAQRYYHHAPNADEVGGEYKFVYANGNLEISPYSDHEQLAEEAGIALDQSGPLAVGYISVDAGMANWSVSSNIGAKAISKILKDYTKHVGWNWGGMTDIAGEPVGQGSEFAPKGSAYRWRFADGQLYIGERDSDLIKRIISNTNISVENNVFGECFLTDKIINIISIHKGSSVFFSTREAKTMLSDLVKAFNEVAEDRGLTFVSGLPDDGWADAKGGIGDNVIKRIEDLELDNLYDPNPKELDKHQFFPSGDTRERSGVYKCDHCGRLLPTYRAYKDHLLDHEPPGDEPNQDGKFPTVDMDATHPTHFTEQQPNVEFPVSSVSEARRVAGFNEAADLGNYNNDDFRHYISFSNGDPVAYLSVSIDGEVVGFGGPLWNIKHYNMINKAKKHFSCLVSYNNSISNSLIKVGNNVWKWAAGQDPKDLLEEEIPFIYDVQDDIITVGTPGQKTSQIPGQFTPGGIVEGTYEPGGKVYIRSQTNMPYTIRHLIQLFYYEQPTLEVKSVYLKNEDGSDKKVAGANYDSQVLDNDNFRKVLQTDKTEQYVAMCLKKGEEIGSEVHNNTKQTFKFIQGKGKVVRSGQETEVGPNQSEIVRPGTRHNVINTGDEPLKFLTTYEPPHHIDGRVQRTKALAEADTEDEQYGARSDAAAGKQSKVANVIEVEGEGVSSIGEFAQRRPFVYLPDDDELFFGQPKMYHDDVYEGGVKLNHPDFDYATTRKVEGWYDGADGSFGYYNNTNVGNAEKKRAAELVQQHLGLETLPEPEPESEWKFGTTVVEHGEVAPTRDTNIKGLETRRPWIYDATKDVVHLGPYGTHHSDMDVFSRNPIYGYVMDNGEIEHYAYDYNSVPDPDLVGLAIDAVADHLGIKQKEVSRPIIRFAATDISSTVLLDVAQDPAAQLATRALQQAEGRVFAVGGAVRDAAMGKPSNDVDLMVQGIPTETVEQALKALDGRVDYTGKDFGVFRYKSGGDEVEIALPRKERSTGKEHKDFDVQADHTMKPEEDLYRRDFTANAMAVDLATGELLDPYNGAQDIAEGKLRTVHEHALSEDPLRVLRAVTAHGKHGLEPDEGTRAQMVNNAESLTHLPKERIQAELDKIMASPDPAKAITLAHETGVLEHILPEVDAAFGYDQNNPHHELELGSHLVNVLKRASEITDDPDVRLASLLHDVGKPNAEWTDPETGKSHYYKGPNGEGANHEEVGADMVEQRLNELKYPKDRIKRVKDLVTHHMFPAFKTPRGARRFLNRVGDHADDLMNLRWADQGGKSEYPTDPTASVDDQRMLIDQIRQGEQPTQLSQLAINGNDLLQLGMEPGPEVGATLKRLTDLVIDNPELNNRESLLGLINNA